MTKIQKSIKHSLRLALGLSMGIMSAALHATTILTLNEGVRLEANIGIEVGNRLHVSNDRIEDIFGDEDAFVTEKHEKTGQVFIKATPENGSKPLYITLVTENGLTQDLTLSPVDEKANTIILKATKAITQKYPQENSSAERFLSREDSQADQRLWVLKQAVLGELQEADRKIHPKTRKMDSLNIKYQKCYQSGAYGVLVWELKNTSKTPQEVLERNLYQIGDVAVSLQKRNLQPNEKTLAFVLVSL